MEEREDAIRSELATRHSEPLLRVEKKLIAWSLGIGIGSLAILIALSRWILPAVWSSPGAHRASDSRVTQPLALPTIIQQQRGPDRLYLRSIAQAKNSRRLSTASPG